MPVEAIPLAPESSGAFTDEEIISRAREITGNKVDRSAAERHATDSAILNALQPAIRDLNLKYGTASSLKEVSFTTVAGVQDYDIVTYVGADVGVIQEVLQAAAYVSDAMFTDGDIDPTTGFSTRSNSMIDPGLQGDVFDVIASQRRARRDADYTYRVVGNKLRLFPPPESEFKVVVSYAVNGYSIDTLPLECREALVWAACVAILNAMLNKLMSSIVQSQVDAATASYTSDRRVAVIEKQRDYYQNLYQEEFRRLRGS